jgi:hypothetical protein
MEVSREGCSRTSRGSLTGFASVLILLYDLFMFATRDRVCSRMIGNEVK